MTTTDWVVEEIWDLNVGGGGKIITNLSMVPCEKKYLGLVFGIKVIPLVSLPSIVCPSLD